METTFTLLETLKVLSYVRSTGTQYGISENCKLFLGNRGSGKSVGLARALLRLALARQFACLTFDLPGDLSSLMVGQLDAHGMLDRTYIDLARMTDSVLSWPFARKSSASDILQRQIESDLATMEMSHGFYARRHEKSGEAKPYTDRYLRAAIAVWLSQKTPKPLNWLIKIFDPNSPEHDLMMAEAQDRLAVHIFDKIERLRFRSPVQYSIETGPAERMLQPVTSPVIFTRHGDSIDWTELLEQKAQVYFDLSGVSTDAARTLAIFAYTAVINACRRYHARYRKPLPVVIVLEEAGALDLITPVIITAMQELRKAGVYVWIVSLTTDDFRDRQVFEQMMGLVDERIYYRMSSGLDRVAQDVTTPIFNPFEIYYEHEQQVRIGEREVRTKSTGISKGPDGKERKDEREGVAFLPIYGTEMVRHYKPYQLKESEIRQELATLKTFERFVVGKNGVRKEIVPPLPDAWPLGLTEVRTKRAIEQIRSRPCYSKPVMVAPPPIPTKKGKGGVK